MKSHMTVRVHLKSGQTITFAAEKVTTERDRMTGEIETLKWVGATGETPVAFAAGSISAVTTEHTRTAS